MEDFQLKFDIIYKQYFFKVKFTNTTLTNFVQKKPRDNESDNNIYNTKTLKTGKKYNKTLNNDELKRV